MIKSIEFAGMEIPANRITSVSMEYGETEIVVNEASGIEGVGKEIKYTFRTNDYPVKLNYLGD